MASLVLKLVTMATILRHSISAMSSSDSFLANFYRQL